MTERNEIYRCNVCGNIIQVVHASWGDLVCCGQPMELMKEKTTDQGSEKHVPVIEKTATGVRVKVGSIPHPMEEAHYIEWIQLIADDIVLRKYLKPGDAPEAEFPVTGIALKAREYCNIHGLWSSK
jgi:superoxide reductase